MDHPFEIGKPYRNRKGSYEILAIKEPKMRIRYEDGSEAIVTISTQARIWQAMKDEEQAPKRAGITSGKAKKPRSTRRSKSKGQPSGPYWLWVTRPEYYEDEYGEDREDLYPGASGQWTCHKNTLQGDLIFLYRAKKKMDIAYLFRAVSNARSDPEWDFICDFKVLQKLINPITIEDLRNDEKMQNWPPLRAQFQGRSFSITSDDWEGLIELIDKKNRGFKERYKKY